MASEALYPMACILLLQQGSLALPPILHCLVLCLDVLPLFTKHHRKRESSYPRDLRQKTSKLWVPQHARKGMLLWQMPDDSLHATAMRFSAIVTLPELQWADKPLSLWWSTDFYFIFFLLCSYILHWLFSETEADWNSSCSFCLNKKEQKFINHGTTCSSSKSHEHSGLAPGLAAILMSKRLEPVRFPAAACNLNL